MCGLPWHHALRETERSICTVCIHTVGTRAGWQGSVRTSVLSVMTVLPLTYTHHYQRLIRDIPHWLLLRHLT